MQRKTLEISVVVLALQCAALAQSGDSDQIEFSPPRRASVMQTNGGTSRGNLIRISSDTVVMQSGSNEFEIEMANVRRIRSSDGDFDHSPSKETFDVLFARAARIPGVVIKEGVGPARPVEPAPALQTTLPQQTVPVEDPPTTTLPPGATVDPVVGNPTDTEIVREPGANFVTICENCGKQIPNSIKQGDRCPHCDIIIWNQDHETTLAQANANAGARNGDAGGRGPAARNGFPEPDPAAAAASGTQSQIVNGTASSFADIPLWMKVSFFAGLLVVGWLLLQRR